MKTRIFCMILVVVMASLALTGCRAKEVKQDVTSAGRALERGVESVGDTVKRTVSTTTSKTAADAALTQEKAQSIALKHAGLTADQVTGLHTEYEIEHGVGQYDVEFRHGNWKYDYEIHADSGQIVSYERHEHRSPRTQTAA